MKYYTGHILKYSFLNHFDIFHLDHYASLTDRLGSFTNNFFYERVKWCMNYVNISPTVPLYITLQIKGIQKVKIL